MHLARVCLVLLLVSNSVTDATDWAEGVVVGVAKGVRQNEGDAPWPSIKTKQEGKRYKKRWASFSDKRQGYDRRPRPCCGSEVSHKATEPLGQFSRVISGPSVKIEDVPSKASAPPSAVTDLSVTSLALLADGRYALGLAWTAPGGFLAGAASHYIFRLSDDQRDLTQSGFDEAAACTLLHAKWEDLEPVLRRTGTPVALNVTFSGELNCDRDYFVALKAIDDGGTAGRVSNLAYFNSAGMRFPAPFDRTISDLKKLIEEMSNRNGSQKTNKKMKNSKRHNKIKLHKIQKNIKETIQKFRNQKQRKQTNKKNKTRKRRKKMNRKLQKARKKQKQIKTFQNHNRNRN
ncbi:uncharacterized protein LOC125038155 [Penaeus chinensis]|uniref:uncharacterized protein LOC125038155 n=1 Tax=Penaeus chinensis TaxID=139456 RepID=UPI001FB69204|nr:uncharacterized protein LOC125038155 [Penaeus chinensis]